MTVPVLKTAIANGRPARLCRIGKYVCSVMLHSMIVLPCLSQTIGHWNFTGSTTGTGNTYNTVSNADFSAAIPTRTYHGASEYFGEGGWPSSTVPDPTYYLQFTISPNAGYQLDITSIVLRMRRSTTGSSGSGPNSWSLRSSLDGYAADLGTSSLTSSYNNYTVTLGSGFLHVYIPVTFRLYGFNATVSSGGGLSRVVLDDISIQGIGAVLPVNLTGIQAVRNNEKSIAVKWQMNNVEAGTSFNVQRSVNGFDFTTLNNITEKEYKTSNAYNYTDNQVPVVAQPLYYRVQGIQPSGQTFFSPVVKIGNKAATQAQIGYTSIQGQSLLTALQAPEKGTYRLSIIGLNGAILQQRSVEMDAGTHVITLPLNALGHGVYVIRLAGNKLTSSKKFVW
ncbi:T9SS type A sorting domain-containing protein [Niastella populi]|uniref:Secretion system C-terminal sorting domain-containing protein n=1 Tax=Niastella populi TaxID=550983 RepID=A0A1V9FDR6_9BACT|nr:T9SS type A sorting domain-containing protein [Niastella populi]OQP56336.1 hypothetical protein A4R26_25915 [Niastella populi]